MPIKKYLNDTGVNSVIQETRKRIADVIASGFKAELSIVGLDPIFYNQDCVITSSVLVNPITITLNASGKGVAIVTSIGTYTCSITVNGTTYSSQVTVDSCMRYVVEVDSLKIVTFSDGTDAEIAACIAALDAGKITTEDLGWDVGDTRDISLKTGTYRSYYSGSSYADFNVTNDKAFSGSSYYDKDVQVVIVDGAYSGTGHYTIGFKNPILFDKTILGGSTLNGKYRIEATATNANGWHGSYGKTLLDNIYDIYMPDYLKSIAKEFELATASKGGTDASGVTKINTYMSLFAVKELYGSSSRFCTADELNCADIKQLEYFKTAANRSIKYKPDWSETAPSGYWLRSPHSDYSNKWIAVSVNGGGELYGNWEPNLYNTGIALAVPFFVI